VDWVLGAGEVYCDRGRVSGVGEVSRVRVMQGRGPGAGAIAVLNRELNNTVHKLKSARNSVRPFGPA
jgi:hypothetical protein